MANNDLNLCHFIGRLVKDPEVRTVGDTKMCSFTLACGWKTSSKDGTEWVRVVAYNKLAEVIGEYMKKGSQMYISGRMSTRSYEKDGQTRYSTEVIADRMQMLGHAKGGEAPKQQTALPDMDSDIPF
jgi:single-strand DNA-binding protein